MGGGGGIRSVEGEHCMGPKREKRGCDGYIERSVGCIDEDFGNKRIGQRGKGRGRAGRKGGGNEREKGGEVEDKGEKKKQKGWQRVRVINGDGKRDIARGEREKERRGTWNPANEREGERGKGEWERGDACMAPWVQVGCGEGEGWHKASITNIDRRFEGCELPPTKADDTCFPRDGDSQMSTDKG